jgi:hypothetical protein
MVDAWFRFIGTGLVVYHSDSVISHSSDSVSQWFHHSTSTSGWPGCGHLST